MRSRASLERVLEAGEELLIEKGWEGFTVQEVSRRANVSIGSIYARAPSKESLILAVYDRAVERIAEDNAAVLTPDSLSDAMDARQLITEAVTEVGHQLLRHEPILRVIMTRGAVDPVIRERGDVQIRRLADRWESVLLRQKDAFRHPDPALAIEVAFRMVFATMSRRVTYGPNFGAHAPVDDEPLLAEMGRAVAAYLLEP